MKTKPKPTRAEAKRAISEWNRKMPVGSPVRYFPTLGGSEYRDTTTRSEAALAHPDSKVAVIFVDGIAGYVALAHVVPQLKRETQPPREDRGLGVC